MIDDAETWKTKEDKRGISEDWSEDVILKVVALSDEAYNKGFA